MSVGLYDKALVEKFQKWTNNTQITLIPPNDVKRLFQVVADTHNDAPIQLPLIVLSRMPGYTILDTAKRPLSFDGATLDANNEVASQLNAIPISISYQLDVFTRYFDEADEFTRNLVFNIINYPKVDVIVPYHNQNYRHSSSIQLDADIDDNSDIPERLISGEFTRHTIKFTVDNAYLFDVRYRDVYSICIDTEMSNNSMEDDMKDIKLV